MESCVASVRNYRPLREKIQWNVEKTYIAASAWSARRGNGYKKYIKKAHHEVNFLDDNPFI